MRRLNKYHLSSQMSFGQMNSKTKESEYGGLHPPDKICPGEQADWGWLHVPCCWQLWTGQAPSAKVGALRPGSQPGPEQQTPHQVILPTFLLTHFPGGGAEERVREYTETKCVWAKIPSRKSGVEKKKKFNKFNCDSCHTQLWGRRSRKYVKV